jgi:hypothetical protein
MSRFVRLFAIVYLISVCAHRGYPQSPTLPWSPEVRCNLNPAHPGGLHPDAYAALQKLALGHRITQGLNESSDGGNVHYADGMVNGKPYTGAADISVRCLTTAQIKTLLERLAGAGFAGWYRKQGQDDWNGPPHIHAVWAGCRLKPVLRKQVQDWLNGKNGLGSEHDYRFWQPSPQMKDEVRSLYSISN